MLWNPRMETSILSLFCILSFCFLVLFTGLTLTLAQPGRTCTTCNYAHGNYTNDSNYNKNLQTLLSIITSNTQIDYGFYNFSVGHDSDKVYGIGTCRFDVSVPECRGCLYEAAQVLPELCPSQKEAIGYYESRCMLRYSDRSIFGIIEDTPYCLRPIVQGSSNIMQGPEGKQFYQTLNKLMDELREKAAAGNSRHKNATGAANVTAALKIYALTQCNPDLSSSDCSTCLQRQISKLSVYSNGTAGGGISGPSCMVEFETFPFVTQVSESPNQVSESPVPTSLAPSGSGKPGKPRRMQKIWIAIVVLLGLLILLATLGFKFLHRRKGKMQQKLERNDGIKCVDSLQFNYDIIEDATENFSDAKRLGRDTSAVVYKGMLPDGQEIAVKRLFKRGRDSEVEFNNELLLLANLQHRNLVKLIGFCIKKDVRLLVYEFLPNESLDWLLYDPIKRLQLDWEIRLKIILGTARGLLYLHEDSQLRIIHRNLKASNILLGVEMNPKISNFTRASRFHVDEPGGGTSKIKGTFGNMPPEYLLQGNFSIKSDVFSFGVLLLEIINGQTIGNFSRGETEESLISFAWRKWSEGEALDMVDKTMQSIQSYATQILKCIKIALLCVQEDPTCRPTMSVIVFMLNSTIDNIPEPSRPAFVIHSDVPLSSSDHSGSSNQGSLYETSMSQLDPR